MDIYGPEVVIAIQLCVMGHGKTVQFNGIFSEGGTGRSVRGSRGNRRQRANGIGRIVGVYSAGRAHGKRHGTELLSRPEYRECIRRTTRAKTDLNKDIVWVAERRRAEIQGHAEYSIYQNSIRTRDRTADRVL